MSDIINTIKSIQRYVGVTADGVFGPVTASAVWRDLNEDSDQGSVIGDQEDLDERTLRNIATLDPKCRDRFVQFARLAKATAATLGCDYVMISGNRSYAEQDVLYNSGRGVTKARGGYSNHNFGIAGDFGVFRGKAYLDDTDAAMAAKVHKACSVHAAACGLAWGGSWNSFKDLPHYEVETGLTLAAKRTLMKGKGSVL
jgi:peptidoglycan L-alanyl-D-glutamate endopeptidase CwlK